MNPYSLVIVRGTQQSAQSRGEILIYQTKSSKIDDWQKKKKNEIGIPINSLTPTIITTKNTQKKKKKIIIITER